MANASSSKEKHVSAMNFFFNESSPYDCCPNRFNTHRVDFEHANHCIRCEQPVRICCASRKYNHKTESNTKDVKLRTAFLKANISCCINCPLNLEKIVSKFKGVCASSVDKEKNLITVTGTMDVKALQNKIVKEMKKTATLVSLTENKSDGCCNACGSTDDYECYCYCYRRSSANSERYYYPTPPPLDYFSEENANACTVM